MDIEKFHDELIDLWNNYYNTEYVYDIIFVDDDYIEVKCENKKIANEFADFIMAYYKAPICYDFRKENGCYQFSISPSLMIRESKTSAKKSIKEERYNVELSDYSGSIVDEETFDKKSDAIQWAKDNGRNCYARIWDNEEGKTVKKWKVKSIKESSDVVNTITSEIDKSYWIDKLIDDLDRHYESMEKAWLKNLDKLSDEDILDIVDDCMGKSKTLIGKSEMLKNKMIDDLSKAYDDYIDDIDRQIRIGKSEDEVKEMIETTLENDIKMYLKLAYNNKASSNYFMVKFAEDNLI